MMNLRELLYLLVIATSVSLLMSCNARYLLLDTFSDSVYEYQDDFYVSKVDSTLELHYELWSQNASLWLSALNSSKDLLFIIADSSYVNYNGEKYYFDLLVDVEEYTRQLSQIPNIADYAIGDLFPVLPGRWKGMLGQGLPFAISDFEGIDPETKFTKENSPVVMSIQTCFYKYPIAYLPTCKTDSIWVEAIVPIDGSVLRALENDREFKKADKFFITNAYMN